MFSLFLLEKEPIEVKSCSEGVGGELCIEVSVRVQVQQVIYLYRRGASGVPILQHRLSHGKTGRQ